MKVGDIYRYNDVVEIITKIDKDVNDSYCVGFVAKGGIQKNRFILETESWYEENKNEITWIVKQ